MASPHVAVAQAAASAAPVTSAAPAASGAEGSPGAAIRFDAALEATRDLPRLHSLLVSWRGETVLERYFNGHSRTRLANIKSASKSVVSALVGLAIERGLLRGVDQPIASFFPDLQGRDDSAAKGAITVEDLLTMRSGLESTSNRNYGAWVQSANWVRFALTRQLLQPPGTAMSYSTGNTHLLSAILTTAAGKSTRDFAQQVLADPLGFTLSRWPQDPQGIYFGGNDMLMTPLQMLAFGRLYLEGGRAGGRQVVPRKWVEDSTVARTRSPRSEEQYGYGWWIKEMAGRESFYAWGFGGQYIFVVPSLELVVVTTSSATVGDERRSHRRNVMDVVEDLVIGHVASLGP
jgi:CubicO group peptidase (beta-lactamase class C family)